MGRPSGADFGRGAVCRIHGSQSTSRNDAARQRLYHGQSDRNFVRGAFHSHESSSYDDCGRKWFGGAVLCPSGGRRQYHGQSGRGFESSANHGRYSQFFHHRRRTTTAASATAGTPATAVSYRSTITASTAATTATIISASNAISAAAESATVATAAATAL